MVSRRSPHHRSIGVGDGRAKRGGRCRGLATISRHLYGRDEERAADRLGLAYSVAAGYDAEAPERVHTVVARSPPVVARSPDRATTQFEYDFPAYSYTILRLKQQS